jgi:hypothetical protein
VRQFNVLAGNCQHPCWNHAPQQLPEPHAGTMATAHQLSRCRLTTKADPLRLVGIRRLLADGISRGPSSWRRIRSPCA